MIYTSNSCDVSETAHLHFEVLNPDRWGSTAAIPSSYFSSRNRTPSQQTWCKTKSNKRETNHRVPVRSNFTTHQATPSEHLVWWEAITAFFKFHKCVLDGSYVHKPGNWLKVTKPQEFTSSVFFHSHQLSANCNNSSTWIKPNPGAPLQTQLMDIVCIHTHVYV